MQGPVQSRTTHRGRLLTVEVLSFTDGDGRSFDREIVHHPGAVVIVPVLDGDRLLLIRNDRVAVSGRLWELPAGTRDEGEDPRSTAARELEEEAGYRADRITDLGAFHTSPGFTDELVHAYVAEDLHFVGQRLEPGESIEVAELPLVEVLSMIDDGRLRDAKTIAALLMWRRRAEKT